MQIEAPRFKKGDVVCYKGARSALATVTIISSAPYYALSGRVIRCTHTATLIWLTGPKLGTKDTHDTRDLIMVEQAE